jgi:tetratricopeptide (TPR) repeat protein
MKVGWLVMGALALAPGVGWAQQTTVVRELVGDPDVKPSTKMSGHAGSALASGDPAEAAVLAGQALKKDGMNPWAHYRRAAALSDLHRTDEAVAEYKVAEQAFGGVDERGRSLAMYGRANTLAQAGRCAEAQPVFEQYARLVENKDSKGAAQARANASACHEASPEQTAASNPAP